jgi:hypothetical protein
MITNEQTTKAMTEISIGMDALTLVAHLPQVLRFEGNELVAALRFKIYGPTPLLEERISESADPAVLEIIERAGELRKQWSEMTGTQLAFWDSISASSLIDSAADRLIEEAVRHDPKSLTEEVLVESLSVQRMQELAESHNTAENVMALYSSCSLESGSFAHLPMMDFRGAPSERHLARIKKGLHSIEQTRGAILASGRSYHFYGFDLLTEHQWLAFMGRCLLLAPLTDSRYIAHRLIEGEAALRLTRSISKPQIPSVIALL